MNDLYNAPDPSGDIPEVEGRISLDLYILMAVIAVLMITALTQIVSLIKVASFLIGLLHALLIVAAFCCVFVTGWRSIKAQQHVQRRSISMSAALGSLLAGIYTTASATNMLANSALVVFAIVIIFIALCAILLIVLFADAQEGVSITSSASSSKIDYAEGADPAEDTYNDDKQSYLPIPAAPTPKSLYSEPHDYLPSSSSQRRQSTNNPPQNQGLQFPTALPAPAPPMITTSRPQGALNIMPTGTPFLQSLFENDDLYRQPPTGKYFFSRTKSNDIPENCEDAACISEDITRIALCDGVSTSKFSRPWAQLLALQWVKQPLESDKAEDLDQWLEIPRFRWQEWIKHTWLTKINERNSSVGRPEFTPADVNKFISQGANATFLGVLLNEQEASWWALAIGDTCLLHLQPVGPTKWSCYNFPLTHSYDFNDTPPSITSRKNVSSLMASNIKISTGNYKAGDILILATDALAEWMLARLEAQKISSILELLRNNLSNESFAMFVDNERAKKRLKDDDTSLIVIRL